MEKNLLMSLLFSVHFFVSAMDLPIIQGEEPLPVGKPQKLLKPTRQVLTKVKKLYPTLKFVKHSMNPDSTKLVIADGLGNVRLLHGKTGEMLDRFVATRTDLYSIGFNHDGTKIILHSRQYGKEEIYFVDAPGLEISYRKNSTLQPTMIKRQSDDRTKFVTVNLYSFVEHSTLNEIKQGAVQLWDGITGKPLEKFEVYLADGLDLVEFNNSGTEIVFKIRKDAKTITEKIPLKPVREFKASRKMYNNEKPFGNMQEYRVVNTSNFTVSEECGLKKLEDSTIISRESSDFLNDFLHENFLANNYPPDDAESELDDEKEEILNLDKDTNELPCSLQ
ncbi:hypothetical protein H0X06_06385 [Candidatus Dependentiae bacterium]|nr:hypothetical protein [Candidatus Dependentiae bacterium]